MHIVRGALAAILIACTTPCWAESPEPEGETKYERSSFDLRLGVGPWTSTLDRENQGLAGLLVAFDMQFRVSLAGSIVLKARYGRIHWDASPYGDPDDTLEMSYLGPTVRFQYLDTGPIDLYLDLISLGIIGFQPMGGADCGASSSLSTFPGMGANWYLSQTIQVGAQIEYALGGAIGGCTLARPRRSLPNAPENPGVLQMNLGITWSLGGALRS